MSTRDYAIPVFNSLTEDQLIDFLKFFADDNTLARMESDLIATGAERKRYNSFRELMEEIENEDDEDE